MWDELPQNSEFSSSMFFLFQNISKELIQRNFCYKAPREIRIISDRDGGGQMVGMELFFFGS